MNESVRRKLSELCPADVYETGVASLEGLLSPELSRFRYGLSLARKLDDATIDRIVEGPTKDYYDLYFAVNSELNEKVAQIALMLKLYRIEALAANSGAKFPPIPA